MQTSKSVSLLLAATFAVIAGTAYGAQPPDVGVSGVTTGLGGTALSLISTPSVRSAPNGQNGFPFMASALNLASVGYAEQEYLLSGTAQAYIPVTPGRLPRNGRWNVMPNPGATAPYTTRILVRRPIDPKRFNGTVVVEWFNESAGFDTPSDWLYTHDEIVREGYAYVGV